MSSRGQRAATVAVRPSAGTVIHLNDGRQRTEDMFGAPRVRSNHSVWLEQRTRQKKERKKWTSRCGN